MSAGVGSGSSCGSRGWQRDSPPAVAILLLWGEQRRRGNDVNSANDLAHLRTNLYVSFAEYQYSDYVYSVLTVHGSFVKSAIGNSRF